MTASEYLEIALMLREEAQRHFEYWLTISFAFIAATFIGREQLKAKVAIPFGALYLLTVATLISRYAVSGNAAYLYIDLAIEEGAPWIAGADFVAYLRISVFFLGTVLALWFLYFNSCRSGDPD